MFTTSRTSSRPRRPLRLTRRRTALAVAVALGGSLGAAGAAGAQAPGSATGFDATFTTKRAGASAGYTLEVTGVPPAAGTTLPPFLRQTVRFPAGTRFDTRAAEECTASDADVAAQGARGVCPPGSRIGTGVAEGVLGGQPVRFDLVAYNFPSRIHFAAESNGVSLKRGFYGTYRGRTLTIDVGTSGGQIAPTRFAADIQAGRRGGRAYLTTPQKCPATRKWKVVTTFMGLSALENGMQLGTTQTLTDTIRCRPSFLR
jgi:hypothetical protein